MDLSAPSPHDSMESYLLTLEDTFYNEGYDSGYPHGQLHGLFEGRALGKEKGWELWEEIGYYEGVARLWKGVLAANGGGSARAISALDAILSLVDSFPRANNSQAENQSQDTDIPALLTALRSKYKAACATLGTRARLTATAGGGEEEKKSMSL